MDVHPPLDAPEDGVLLVEREIVFGPGTEDDENLLQRAGDCTIGGRDSGGGLLARVRRVLCVLDQLLGHLPRRQHIVDKPRGNGTAGHPSVFGGFLVLRHHHAESTLDRLHTQGAVRSCPGEDDAHRVAFLVLG